MARQRWLVPEAWEFADPEEDEGYHAKREAVWERAKLISFHRPASFRVQGREQREEFTFEDGVLVSYQRLYLADSEADA